MGIKLVEAGTSAIVGGVDVLAEYIDEKQSYVKPFQRITDWGRLLYVGGGYVANYMEVGDDEVSKAMVLAGIPLLEKSIVDCVKVYALKGKGKKKGRMGLKLKQPGNLAGNIRWG